MLVYKAENKLNGNLYIGKTTRSLEERRNGHISESKSDNLRFHNALRKYGPENFAWSVLLGQFCLNV
jgi:predicted GIY-YIG superfamily endonuclease